MHKPTPFSLPEQTEQKNLSQVEQDHYVSQIKQRLSEKNAVLIAHYYTDPRVQRLADETGGLVSDSLEMARFGRQHTAHTLVVAGVYFMGETAKILSPEKRVIMPSLEATCSLDLGCPSHRFQAFCDLYPNRTRVVYANTSAAVKAQADWVVTSSVGLEIIRHLSAEGKKILWAPDRYLGDYIRRETGADMVLWEGACVVHEEFKAKGIAQLKQLYPQASVLAHPESPAAVIEMADVVGSTSKLVKAVQTLQSDIFIVATDRGILYKMQQAAPGKSFLVAPTGGVGATCRSCAHCPWMGMNTLKHLLQALEGPLEHHEIQLPHRIIKQARIPLERMLAFNQEKTIAK